MEDLYRERWNTREKDAQHRGEAGTQNGCVGKATLTERKPQVQEFTEHN